MFSISAVSLNVRLYRRPGQVLQNADMRLADLRKFCALDETGKNLMQSAVNPIQLSASAYHRVLKLARKNGDPADSERLGPSHLAEAPQYRPKLNMMDGK